MSLQADTHPVGIDDFGCCEGPAARTPVEVYNRPGLAGIAYRVGTHAEFKLSMLTRLSASDLPGLRGLNTHDDDDFAVALLDAWAMVADVLTFYQERIANESYLRTATERASLLELARLVGYEPGPGAAASTYLAFELEDAPGSPTAATIDAGTKVQSLPGQNELPQTFETTEKIEARVEWNELRPRQSRSQAPADYEGTYAYLKGLTTNLRPGDPLLILGPRKWSGEGSPQSKQWNIRYVSTVEPEAGADRTLVRWDKPLDSNIPPVEPTATGAKVFTLRLRASLFGYNAPQWDALPEFLRDSDGFYAKENHNYADQRLPAGSKHINLDAVYPQILAPSWIVLSRAPVPPAPPSPPSREGEHSQMASLDSQCYRVEAVHEEAKAEYTIAAKSTRLELSGESLDWFSPRTTTVYAQSEELELAEHPQIRPVQGDRIVLDRLLQGLETGRLLTVSGKRTRVMIADATQELLLEPADHSQNVTLQPGDTLQVLEPPTSVDSLRALMVRSDASSPLPTASPAPAPGFVKWHLMDRDGVVGFVTAKHDEIILTPATDDDPTVSEIGRIKHVSSGRDRTTITLHSPLQNSYDRMSTTMNANVAPATHGETKEEVLGSGDGSTAYQRFALRESPLTYVHSAVPGGAQSTLRVRVNDLLWHEVQSLYGHGPNERIFVTRRDDDGKTTMQFGDGSTGARPPTGQENVRAAYRKGIGLEGMVKADQLSLLLTRPLGVRSVTNPQAATDAADPEPREEVRRNAPLTALTLDRVVSLQDHEDFARSYAGISKALATWVWDGEVRGVFVTVAGPDGEEPSSDLLKDLLYAIRKAGDPYHPLFVEPYQPALFNVDARVKVDADFLPDKVLAAAEESLRARFSFEVRSFGQSVALSEVIAVVQEAPGAVAVDMNKFYRECESGDAAVLGSQCAPEKLSPRLDARGPQVGVSAAELLTLNPAPLDLEEMR